ncbi:hypothetical protein [Ekhidna sp.]|uniref:hypothetical protein n=1 Tax=Ekhidna sp. TaxID=2608089 RepID=UPI00329833E0
MKRITLYSLLASFIIYMGCSSNSEDPGLDCSQSDLDVSITSSVLPTCEVAGSIVVQGSGGTAPYSFSLDGTNFQTSGSFTDLVAGNLSITVMDDDGCTARLSSVLNSDGGISIDALTTNSECLNATGTIEVTASDGDGTYTYSLDGGTAQTENSFSSVSAGDHEITVVDGTGCSATTDVYVSSDVSLSSDIMPLLLAQCTFSGCHNGDNGSSRNWTEKEDVLAKAANIKSRTQSGSMPRSPGVLTQAEIDLIACWVDDGAKDN